MQNPPHFIGSAPGKIILSGEHSVVHGYPAVVMATKIGSTVEVWEDDAEKQENLPQPADLSAEVIERFIRKMKDIFATQSEKSTEHLLFSLKTELPIQSGMGSSASFAAATLRAMAKWAKLRLTDEQLFALVQESEKDIHGNPSGADAAAIVYDGVIRFQKLAAGIEYHPLEITSMPDFYLINSGKPVETTGEMIEYVAQKHAAQTLQKMGEVTTQLITALEKGDEHSFLLQIEKNQRLLKELGVVSDKAQKWIEEIEKVGGVAKITGAGGRADGSGMIIAFHGQPQILEELFQEQKINYVVTGIRQGRVS